MPAAPAPAQPPAQDLNMTLVSTINQQQALIHKQHDTITQMLDQLASHNTAAPGPAAFQGKPKAAPKADQHGNLRHAASLGVIRLDYDYPPTPGDIDHPASFGYDVFYRVVPGFTFARCQSGRVDSDVEANFVSAVKWMEGRGVSGITGDCGFMMYFQALARQHTYLPVFMSSLAQLPAVTCAYNKNELIAILTANSETLKPMRTLIKEECAVDPEEHRYIMVGCQDVDGFEQVALGGKVDTVKVTPGIVKKCREVLAAHPKIRGFLFECTELPAYSDAVRCEFGLPVWDSITCCDFFVNGFKDNPRFGLNDWQHGWDGQQAHYTYGSNLNVEAQAQLVNKVHRQ